MIRSRTLFFFFIKDNILTNKQYHLHVHRPRKVQVLGELCDRTASSVLLVRLDTGQVPTHGFYWALKYTRQVSDVLRFWLIHDLLLPSLFDRLIWETRGLFLASGLQYLQIPITEPPRVSKCRCDLTLLSWGESKRKVLTFGNLWVQKSCEKSSQSEGSSPKTGLLVCKN